jgi:hypothetical protein
MVNQRSLEILATEFSEGSTHDFHLFKESSTVMAPHIRCLADTGYLGIDKLHPNSQIPAKNSKLHPLTPEQKRANRELASQRICCEHVIARLKVFRILSDRYRNRRKRFGLRFNLIAAIYNFELQSKS